MHLTPRATDVIRDLLDETDLPEGAGLRIAQRDDHTALAMSLEEEPGEADVVVRDDDVAVFLGPAAAHRLEEQVLDASSTETGVALFLHE